MKSLYPQAYDTYAVSRVTVGPATDTVRYVLVESPMEHDLFKEHYRRLGKIGVMIPMVEMINCAIRRRDVLDTRAGRSWMHRTSDERQALLRREISTINSAMQAGFKGLLRNACSDCQVLEYCDGLMVIEVRRVVDWDKLNRFDVTV
ncbi:hypothetical protein D3C76_89480 [compost metagenome]